MKLFKLLKGIRCRVLGSTLIEIEGLYHKDKEVKNKGMYFCLTGSNFDGVNYVNSAIKSGATAIVSEREIQGVCGITQILVKDIRKAMSLISVNFYNNPAKKLKLIGVTGTNGKTTTTYMISGLLKNLGFSSAIIGTNGVIYNDKRIETGMTTPDPIELNRILRILADKSIEYVCMEVSAHSIFYKKIEGLRFEVMVFSNLTEDHLDFFGNMENYFNSKKLVFDKKHTKQSLINIDDKYGKILADCIITQKKTYAILNEADYLAGNLGIENGFQKFLFRGSVITAPFLGEFNILNLLSAIACIEMLNINIGNIQECVNRLKSVPGRFNTMVINKKLFIIDYAHTPDGLENVLKLCKNIAKNKKLICLFGCGGNRETQKRAKMGEISSKIADFTIITTDNPRYEDRLKIAEDIKLGLLNNNYKIILDRVEAINYANIISGDGDVVLIAGKGVEDYIEECGVKMKYSDYEQILKLRK